MAHTLTFGMDKGGGNIATIVEHIIEGKEPAWMVVHRDNRNIIVESPRGDRRVYEVREWFYTESRLQCRATRME